MSRLIMGISGAVALSLISGAAELARGRDLAPVTGHNAHVTQALSLSFHSATEGVSSVNRASKADRITGAAGSPAKTRTISLKLDGFSETTFLVRIPVAAANPPAAAPMPVKPVFGKPMLACEPVVSVLTEVAKRLEPGRCVT
jgi:hypothetical protein